MKLRYTLLVLCLGALGINSWALNKYGETDLNVKIVLFLSIFCFTAISLCLALQSLKANGVLNILSYFFPLPLAIASDIKTGASSVLYINTGLLIIFFIAPIIDALSRDLGSQNEKTFLLTSAAPVRFFTSMVWFFFWTSLYLGINLVSDHAVISGTVLLIMAAVVGAFSFFKTRNLIMNRVVVVPNGIVINDSIKLTDTILLPLSKIKDIKTITPKEVRLIKDNENKFISITGNSLVTQITLLEKTDSFIIRKNFKNTERKDIDELNISLVKPLTFEMYFRSRFHQNKDEPIDEQKEKVALLKTQKELGIETAPKSDAKLPEWRKKKKTK